MLIGKEYLLNSLLRENYFPYQKKRKDELPPFFTSSGLIKTVAENIHHSVGLNKERKSRGFDVIQYKETRYNNVPRLVSIPHPKPYIDI